MCADLMNLRNMNDVFTHFIKLIIPLICAIRATGHGEGGGAGGEVEGRRRGGGVLGREAGRGEGGKARQLVRCVD